MSHDLKPLAITRGKKQVQPLVSQAQESGPQIVTKHGKEAVIVISIDEYNTLTKPKKGIAQFFQESPLVGEDIFTERSKEKPREVDL